MNIKINKEQHDRLLQTGYGKYLFGSQLHGISDENSDTDYVMVYEEYKVFPENGYELNTYLPNIHSFQYDDKENNTQYVWMSTKQFWRNLWSGDGNMIADIVLLSGEFQNPLFLCCTSKIIRGYLGAAKRDLKLHGDLEKKRFHAYRSIMMADKLMSNILPNQLDIIKLKESTLPSRDELFSMEKMLRDKLNSDKEIPMHPIWKTGDNLLALQIQSNNIKEFKYD